MMFLQLIAILAAAIAGAAVAAVVLAGAALIILSLLGFVVSLVKGPNTSAAL